MRRATQDGGTGRGPAADCETSCDTNMGRDVLRDLFFNNKTIKRGSAALFTVDNINNNIS